MAFGRKKKKDNLVPATYMLPRDIKEEIEHQADAEGESASHALRQILRERFKGNKRKPADSDPSQP